MGVLNRTTDSFFAPAATFELDDALRARGPSSSTTARTCSTSAACAPAPVPRSPRPRSSTAWCPSSRRCTRASTCPISVDTWRASVAKACFARRRGRRQRHLGVRGPRVPPGRRGRRRLGRRDAHPAAATGRRPRPGLRRRRRRRCAPRCAARAHEATAAGIAPERVHGRRGARPGQDARPVPRAPAPLGRARDARVHARAVGLQQAVPGRALGLEIHERDDASLAAAALGISLGCRVLRVHDVRGTVRVRDALASVLEAA